jgi:predicted esterase
MHVSFAVRFGAMALLLAGSVSAVAATTSTEVVHRCEAQSGALPTVVQTTLHGVPAILRIPAHIAQAPIILWHGFGPPASESAMMEALPLDDVDAVKVYLGLPLFGARAPVGGMKELARRQSEDVGLEVFKPVVAGAADELPGVVAALVGQGCMKNGSPVRLVGFSAGGAVVLHALSQGRVTIVAAVLINPSTGLSDSIQAYEHATGKTYGWSTASRELARQTDAAVHTTDIARHRPALLLLQGASDPVLDAQAVPALCNRLAPLYGDQASRLQCQQLAGMSHQWAADPGSLAIVRKAVGAWFIGMTAAPTQ